MCAHMHMLNFGRSFLVHLFSLEQLTICTRGQFSIIATCYSKLQSIKSVFRFSLDHAEHGSYFCIKIRCCIQSFIFFDQLSLVHCQYHDVIFLKKTMSRYIAWHFLQKYEQYMHLKRWLTLVNQDIYQDAAVFEKKKPMGSTHCLAKGVGGGHCEEELSSEIYGGSTAWTKVESTSQRETCLL